MEIKHAGSLTQRMTIGDFLLRRLEEAGIRHLFGVPGDYNLTLLQQLHDSGALEWVGNTGELVSSYAADGYARLKGLGALLVTNGVGSLSALNGVAGSYAEHVPTICICGSIPLRSIDRGLGMHHTMADGNFDHFLRAYAPVTAAQARITPRNAVLEIDRLILTAWREKLPVYMEFPSDISYLEIEVPAAPLVLADEASDPERLRSCISAVTQRLSAATSPAILVDADADRFRVAPELMELARKLQAPIAVINAAKSVIDESFPHYVGIYAGRGSEPGVRETIESSDCLLAIGYRPIEVTTGDFTATLPAGTIHARGHAVDVGDDNYQAVTLKEVLRGVIEAVPQVTNRAPRAVAATAPGAQADGSATLTQAAYWQAIQAYLRSGDVVYVDNGTSFSILGLKLPPNCTFIGSINWGSIGYSVGALLGALTAAPDRRHVLLVGDGSFQVTAQELSTILRHDHKPVILLINNGGYTIERGYIGKTEPYNDIANWAYAELPKVLHPGASARSFVVRTCGDLQNALGAPNDRLLFVESIMDPCDAPAAITRSSNLGAELDYGPRGPQRRDNLQLRSHAV
ncbi:Indole-3-pyruvate decarboxylase (plasmid) [Caballeronia sp. SBC1]|uniref:alpha-keto acid decarboxylase family protein n=1 Tax=unclassified Caballeronia TaxID=2646786 RepID=UPI0013E197E5|nr:MULTISPECIES: thiamine pyrophosphate-binding protein [unclassified Caballeronia]QIE25900.1 Indole-3-pyruvate decarboxylase [Caballeronia sp. SBC2]QIN64787.1 Indole-3-pyruvate decarboxylase [Caballeronia sp. SBC1]